MDPSFITTPIWGDISLALRSIWLLLLCVIIFAGNFLVAHAILPSLIRTRHLPESLLRLRPLFYMGALVGAAGAIVTLVLASGFARVIGDFYSRWWI